MDRAASRARFIRAGFLAGLVAAGLLASGIPTASAAPGGLWTTTITTTCSGVPAGFLLFVDGNLRNKQGKAMTLDGSKVVALFVASCTGSNTGTVTNTTKHEPVEALFDWHVLDTSTGLLVINCLSQRLLPLPVMAESSGTACSPYGSSTVTITTTK